MTPRPGHVQNTPPPPKHEPTLFDFMPASNVAEAVARIYALTGRTPDNSRGEKRALVALRDALGLDVDLVRTNTVLARALADALNLEWVPGPYTDRNTITLAGLNALLEGALSAAQQGTLRELREGLPHGLAGPEWAAFSPARSKIEAVTRIAASVNAPREWLGPGGKEHKSVLVNLADRIAPDAELNRSSKTKLAASLAHELGVPWPAQCESTGETISLLGLNMLLAGAERRLGVLGSQVSDVLMTPVAEGDALAAALLARLPQRWDGRQSVRWLAERGLRGANDNEWQGFYGEERAKQVLAAAYTPPTTPPPVRFGNTTFDYALNYVWDIKVHTEVQVFDAHRKNGKNETLLNDEAATRACIEQQGLGFIVIGGAARMDETGDFVSWHREFKTQGGTGPGAPSNSGTSRTRKAAFDVLHVESFWVEDTAALDAAILAGALRVRPIGRQAPKMAGGAGAARSDKFEMRMSQARSTVRVARFDWPTPRPR